MAYQSTTRAQFRAMLQERIGPLGTTFYRDDELNGYVQEALRVWNACTGFWKARVLIVTSANAAWYTIPNAITTQLRVSFNDHPMTPSSLPDMDNGRPNWESETTASGSDVPTEPTIYAIVGVTTIAIWPADAVGGNSLVLDGVAATPRLSTDATFVDIGDEELEHIIDYCQVMCKFKQGMAEFTPMIGTLQNFFKACAARNAMLLASAKFKSAMGVDTGQLTKPRQSPVERVGVR